MPFIGLTDKFLCNVFEHDMLHILKINSNDGLKERTCGDLHLSNEEHPIFFLFPLSFTKHSLFTGQRGKGETFF